MRDGKEISFGQRLTLHVKGPHLSKVRAFFLVLVTPVNTKKLLWCTFDEKNFWWKNMLKKCVYFFGGVFIVNALIWTQIPNVATTFGIADATAKSIVNYILSASTAVSVISVIGIIFGVGGFSLAAIQTVKYLAKKSFVKAVAW